MVSFPMAADFRDLILGLTVAWSIARGLKGRATGPLAYLSVKAIVADFILAPLIE